MIGRKNGVSSVVATVSLVLLTIVVVALLVAFIVPYVKENLNESSSCLDYEEYFSFNERFNFNCYDSIDAQKVYKLSVGAKNAENSTGENVEGFKLVLYSNDNSVTKDITSGDFPSTDDGGAYMLNNATEIIKIPNPGETRTYVYNTTELFSEIEIYVKLKSGKVCPDASDSIFLRRCD